MATFVHDGHRLAYTEFGAGERTVVLLHGLLLGQRCTGRWPRSSPPAATASSTLDLLGHGASDRPARHARVLDAGLRRAGRRRCSTTSASTQAVVGGDVARRERDARGRGRRARARARHGHRDAGARQRAARLRASPSRRCMVALTFGEPVHAGRPARRPRRCRRAALAGSPTSCSTRCARTRRRAPRSCRASSSSAWRRRAGRAPHAHGAGARDRAPPRPRAPVLGLRRARRRAARRAAAGGRLDPRAACSAPSG